MGPRNVSIPRDVYEDDANIYSHLHLRSVHMSLFLQRVDVQRRLSFTVLCAGCDCVASSDGELLPMPGLSICFLVVTLLLSSFFPRPCVFRTARPSFTCVLPPPPSPNLSSFSFPSFPTRRQPRFLHFLSLPSSSSDETLCSYFCVGMPRPLWAPRPRPRPFAGFWSWVLCDMPDGGGAAAFGGRPASPGYRRPRLHQSSWKVDSHILQS